MYSAIIGLFLVVLGNLLFLADSLRIGAFNVQTFGRTKFNDESEMYYIEQIMRRYDVVLIQEIRDSSGIVIPGLLAILNSNGEQWDVAFSERLGRSSYKEQYAYYFRTENLSLVSSYQFDDGVDDGTDAFSREPFGVLFDSPSTGDLRRFGLLGVHIAPDEAVAEINGLPEVIEAAKTNWLTENIMIMGDFNADCSYVNADERENLILRKDPSYLWLIGDEVDTTVSSTDCAYDRMVVTGELLRQFLDRTSVKEYRFDEVYDLDEDTARAVSDHYPVEVVINQFPTSN